MRAKCSHTTGNISDVGNNTYYEAERPFVCIYVEIRTNLCYLEVHCMETQLCSWTAKYKNIVTRSVSEYPTTIYYSDIVWAAVLEQTETTGEDRNTIRAVGKARPESEPRIPSRSTGAPIVV